MAVNKHCDLSKNEIRKKIYNFFKYFINDCYKFSGNRSMDQQTAMAVQSLLEPERKGPDEGLHLIINFLLFKDNIDTIFKNNF